MANLFDDLLPNAPASVPKRSPNIFDDLVETPHASALGTAGLFAARGTIPALSGLGGAGAAIAAGAPLIAVSGPFAPLTTVGLGLTGGLLGASAGSLAQEGTLGLVAPEFQADLNRRMAKDARAHPTAALLGQLAPMALTLKPGFRGVPLSSKLLGGGLGAGLEATGEVSRGEPFAPGRIAMAGGVGTFLNRPTALGRRIGFPGRTAPPVTPEPSPVAPRVQSLTASIRAAKPIRARQEALFTAERGRRLARVLGVRERIGGERGFHAELGQLKGALPKAQFESVRPSQGDVDALFNDVNAASSLGPWEQLNAKTGLAKLLGAEGGQVPTRGELDLLGRVFGQGLVKAVSSKRPFRQKAYAVGVEAINLPRALMASFDLSAPLRQGVFLIGRPQQWVPAFGQMFRQFVSDQAFQAAQQQIRVRPTYAKMQQAGLAITDMGEALAGREEAFMSRLGERIPLVGAGVKASNRAYVGFLNKLRADVFDDLLKKGHALGVVDDPGFLSSAAEFVNAATGRGPLGSLERAAVPLNSIFFSPRLLASRLSLLNPAFYVQQHPAIRQEAIKSLLTFASTGASVLGLAKLNGMAVGTDPRSADFGKVKVGNTRYDLWGGFQQPIVAALRLLTGQMVSSTTGREFTLGEGYKPTTRADIVLRFLQSKQAPVLSLITTLLKGETITGQRPRLPVELMDRFIPMFVQDAFEVVREHGPTNFWMAIPGAFGIGVQTYGTLVPMAERTPTGRPKVAFRDQPSMGETLINRATGRQVSNIPAAFHPQLRAARLAEIRRKIGIEQAKRLTLEDGKPRQVGPTRIWLQQGIVKTKTVGRVETPLRVFQQQQQGIPQ